MQAKKLILLALLCCFIPFSNSISAQKEKFDYLFLVDTSGSMMGLPKGSGNEVIFPKVKDAIKAFIEDISDGATVFVLPFNKGIIDRFKKNINTDHDRLEIKRYIDNLKAKGQVTWIYYSIKEALDIAKELRSADSVPHSQIILLYTDGKDNGPQNLDLRKILKLFKLQRGENPYLYIKYITLGVKLSPEEKELLTKTQGVKVIENPKGKVLKQYMVEVTPYILDFGNMRKRDRSTRTLLFRFDNALKNNKMLRFEANFDLLDKHGVAYKVIPSETVLKDKIDLTLTLYNLETLRSLNDRAIKGKLFIKGDKSLFFTPQEVTVQFSLEPEKIIHISSVGSTEVSLDFGKLSFDKQGSAEMSRLLKIDFNEYARETGVILLMKIDATDPESRQALYFKSPDGNLIKDIQVSSGQIIPIVLKTERGMLKPGHYSSKIILVSTDKNTKIEGNGILEDKGYPDNKIIPVRFEVPSPPFPWGKILIPVLAILFIGLLIVILVVSTPKFVTGAVLSTESEEIPLENKLFKRTYTVAGYNADFVLSTLPQDIKFKIKPVGKTENIKIIPVSGKLEVDGTIIPNSGMILSPDSTVSVSGSNNLKYTILGKEV